MKESVLNRPRPTSQGYFSLPKLAKSIPLEIGTSAVRDQALARFALAAEEEGVALPAGEFDSAASVTSRQWSQYIEKTISKQHGHILKGAMELIVTDAYLNIKICALNSLHIVKMKPVIEALEQHHPGLGWYVQRTIGRASAHGINIYDFNYLGHQVDYMFSGTTEDEEFAKEMRMQELGIPQDEDVDEEGMQELRDQHMFLPSDMVAAVGGHRHLLGWAQTPGSGKVFPPDMKRTKAKAIVKMSSMPEELKQCVESAIELDKLFEKDTSRRFEWYPWINEVEEGEDLECIGGACLVVWDSYQEIIELIEHSEVNAYNCGTADECLGRTFLKTNASESEYKQLVRETRAYFEMWNQLATLLAHCEINNGKST